MRTTLITLKSRISLDNEYRISLSLQNNILTSNRICQNSGLNDSHLGSGFEIWVRIYYLSILVATLIEEEFRKYVKQIMDKQEKEYVKKRNIEFKILPDFVNLIKSSSQLSSKQIVSHHFRGQWEVPPTDQNKQEKEGR